MIDIMEKIQGEKILALYCKDRESCPRRKECYSAKKTVGECFLYADTDSIRVTCPMKGVI